ncbi:Hypothetical predicted protein [Scomber scombrus]|uniref:Uncharacterized protein n=1 Tax=Scomber scombrus TaxID=13677 RepID=A0AAV1NM66_SCOSC
MEGVTVQIRPSECEGKPGRGQLHRGVSYLFWLSDSGSQTELPVHPSIQSFIVQPTQASSSWVAVKNVTMTTLLFCPHNYGLWSSDAEASSLLKYVQRYLNIKAMLTEFITVI